MWDLTRVLILLTSLQCRSTKIRYEVDQYNTIVLVDLIFNCMVQQIFLLGISFEGEQEKWNEMCPQDFSNVKP